MHPATPLISTIWSSTKLWKKKTLPCLHSRPREAGPPDGRVPWAPAPRGLSCAPIGPCRKGKNSLRVLQANVCPQSWGGLWISQLSFGGQIFESTELTLPILLWNRVLLSGQSGCVKRGRKLSGSHGNLFHLARLTGSFETRSLHLLRGRW